MASLGWVTPGVATEGVTPLSSIFFLKNLETFFAHHRCHYHYRFLLLSLGCHPPLGCHPTPFLPFRPRFSTILCKFAHKFFSFGCHPLEGVIWGGGSAPRPSSSDTTANGFDHAYRKLVCDILLVNNQCISVASQKFSTGSASIDL